MGDFLTIGTLLARIVLFLLEASRERTERGVGYTKAVKEALEQAHLDLALADAAEREANAQHRADATDAAFDQEFRR